METAFISIEINTSKTIFICESAFLSPISTEKQRDLINAFSKGSSVQRSRERHA
ncbi:hypothetical protein ERO13_A08G205501v2 [Gossypium hirsutum]|uniref:Uncharacterized protein n=3 Tax=Gossypium TaxID=3633 RepID=A0A5J5UV57_GOSBA|nr:hypothetical protein ES319_A08G217800v1 [Gossypium barbadense]KAG4189096.1 hypothetical protein ERO13_A08G205501v2 [Gossypium hirsutum]TYH07530.1 hypothetical protein ES288_A08G241100v1 [Gossypium darwinii]TYI16223.1 hypothetical protein ES332_A08G240500v1 [Gossypium tomentosum]